MRLKHTVKMDVVEQKKGLFGTKEVVKKKKVTLSGKEYRQYLRDKKEAEEYREAQRRAAMFLIVEEELAEKFGEDWL